MQSQPTAPTLPRFEFLQCSEARADLVVVQLIVSMFPSDTARFAQLQLQLQTLPRKLPHRRVVFDFSLAPDFTADAFTLVVTLRKSLDRGQRTMVLCGLNEALSEKFSRANLLAGFTVSENIDSALALIAG